MEKSVRNEDEEIEMKGFTCRYWGNKFDGIFNYLERTEDFKGDEEEEEDGEGGIMCWGLNSSHSRRTFLLLIKLFSYILEICLISFSRTLILLVTFLISFD